MNVICPICSELYKIRTEDIVTTPCGHVFHRSCLDSWLISNITCPSCRKEPTVSRNLIKLYFEQDETKAALSLDEILKTNERQTKELKLEKEKITDMEIKLTQMEAKLKVSTERTKILERQKQLDDMAIAGLKSLKDDSIKEIVKLNGSIKNLKLDYLAEKQLRRIHQQSLHTLDPDNENYNTDIIQIDEPKLNGIPEGRKSIGELVDTSETPSIKSPWNLNCEAKPAKNESVKPNTSYNIPVKIQKASNDPRSLKIPMRFSFKNKEGSKPIVASSSFSSSDAQPSTSAASLNKNQKRTFGEDKLFTDLSFASVTSAGNTGNNAFSFLIESCKASTSTSSTAPKFSFALPTSTSPVAQGFNFDPSLSNRREFAFAKSSPRHSTGSNSTKPDNENGPKMSDR